MWLHSTWRWLLSSWLGRGLDGQAAVRLGQQGHAQILFMCYWRVLRYSSDEGSLRTCLDQNMGFSGSFLAD